MESPPPNEPSTSGRRGGGGRWAPIAVVVTVVVVVVVVVVAAGAWIALQAIGAASFHSATTDTESLSPQQIESVGGFRFPPGAAGIQSRYVSWLDSSLNVRFTLPPAEIDELLDSTQISRPLSQTQIPWSISQTAEEMSWWTPGAPARFEAGGSARDGFGTGSAAGSHDDSDSDSSSGPGTTQPALRQFILIDKTNPQRYTIWLAVDG